MDGILYYCLVRPNLLGYVGECAAIVFGFSGLPGKTQPGRRLLAGLTLLANLLLYTTSGSFEPSGGMPLSLQMLYFVGRALLHTAVVCLYLYHAKLLPPRSCLLLSLLYMAGYQFSIGVRLLVSSVALGQDALLPHLLSTLVVVAVQLAWACVLRHIVRISDLEQISFSRWGVTGTLTLMQIYIRWSLMPSMSGALAAPVWFKQVEYPLIAMVGLLMIQVFYEQSISMQARASKAQVEALCLEYELKSARQQARASDDIRRVYHDMKNHLLAIRTMAGSEQVQQYTEQLMQQFDSCENTVRTGSAVVDALLAEKILLARLDGIVFNVCMDLRGLDFIAPVDLVAIFGNAVDNAIEAVRRIPEWEKRRIYLKSINTPGFVTLVFSNAYVELERDAGGRMVSTKKDREHHGIGLRSIQHAARRYAGAVTAGPERQPRRFELTVLLPLRP